MSSHHHDRSTRFARGWVNWYTAGLSPHHRAARRAEIDSELAEHRGHRQLEGWTPARIARERLRRLLAGMPADVGWRHDLMTAHSQVSGVIRVSVQSVTTLATATVALFHFAFAAYLLGNTALADRAFLGGLNSYLEEVNRPVASAVAATIIAGLGVALIVAALARTVSPVMANAATIAIAIWSVLWFWLGMWPVGLVAVIGSVTDLVMRALPSPATRAD